MTDISDLREGDEIEVVMRLRIQDNRALDKDDGRYTLGYLFEIADRITVVRPEIIPGKPYVGADGKLYVGKTGGRVVNTRADSIAIWYGGPSDRPLPAGLRPAKVVPES